MISKIIDAASLLIVSCFLILAIIPPNYSVGSGPHCSSCKVNGLNSCCETPTDQCPVTAPTCGRVTGGDTCSCS